MENTKIGILFSFAKDIAGASITLRSRDKPLDRRAHHSALHFYFALGPRHKHHQPLLP